MSINNNKAFPQYYPAGCPPKSFEADIEVYRMVESNNIKPRDFVPSGERRRLYQSVTCGSLALSVLGSRDDIAVAYNYFSSVGLQKKNKVAVGFISKESGRLSYDPSDNVGQSHINWWTYEDVQPHTYFSSILRIGVDI